MMKKYYIYICLTIISVLLLSCAEKENSIPEKEKLNYSYLDQKDYKKFIGSVGKVGVIGFFSERDTLNREYMNEFNRSAGRFNDSIPFSVMDIDKNFLFARDIGIKCIPSYILIRNGEPLKTVNGKLDSVSIGKLIDYASDGEGENTLN